MLLDYLRRHHIALVALGGTSYAAIKLPTNSVGAKQIKKNAVISSKVRNGSLLKGDFKSGQVPSGPAGAKGNQGDQGAPGPTASSFASHDPTDFLVQNTGEAQVIALTDSTNGRSGGLLNVPFSARVVVSASLHFHGGDSASSVLCRAKIAPVPGSYTAISQSTSQKVGDGTQVPISAAVDVGPGTYNVQAACEQANGLAVDFDRGDLTAVATAR